MILWLKWDFSYQNIDSTKICGTGAAAGIISYYPMAISNNRFTQCLPDLKNTYAIKPFIGNTNSWQNEQRYYKGHSRL
jgi:hypothetical protein